MALRVSQPPSEAIETEFPVALRPLQIPIESAAYESFPSGSDSGIEIKILSLQTNTIS